MVRVREFSVMGNLGLVPATGSARGKVLFDKKDPSKFTEGTGSTRGHDRWKKKEKERWIYLNAGTGNP